MDSLSRLESLNLLNNVMGFYHHLSTLTTSQREFVNVLDNWFHDRERLFVIVSGGPGSGKTYTVVETLSYVKANIIFMAPTARLASKIGGRTIHSMMRLAWNRGSVLKCIEERLTHVEDAEECLQISAPLQDEFDCSVSKVDIVVLDEVGMLPFWLLYQLVYNFFQRKHPILFVCMGDSCQLKPVMSQYNVFQIPFDSYFKTVHIRMQESKRFTFQYKRIVDGLRELVNSSNPNYVKGSSKGGTSTPTTTAENENDTSDPVKKIQEFVQEHYPIVPHLSEELLNRANRVLAYTNQTVDNCNRHYIENKLKENKLFNLYEYRNQKINRERSTQLRQYCTVVVTENGCGPVFNGTTVTFINYDPKLDVAVCQDEFQREIFIGRSQKTGIIPLQPGFAVTIHKFQGETIDEDNIIFNFDQCKDLHLVYTALSRVRSMDQVLAVVL